MSQADQDLLKAAVAALNRDPRDDESWHVADELLDSQFEFREDPTWPGATTCRGISAFRRHWTAYFEDLAEMRLELEEIFDAGDRYVVFHNWWARGNSGAEAEMKQAGIVTVRDGKIVSWQVFFDRDDALEAAGLRE